MTFEIKDMIMPVNAEYHSFLFAAVVEITNKCNLRCPHCASDSGCPRNGISQTGASTETPFCIRQLGQEKT